MQDFPFAENAIVVRLIVRDLMWAAWAVPVIAFAAFRVRWHLSEGRSFAAMRALGSIVLACGWIWHFGKAWVVPVPIAIDVPALRADAHAFDAYGGPGRIGYFDCTVALGPGRSLAWSARKVGYWTDDVGERWLWVEGNADESAEIASVLAQSARQLAFAPPTAATIDRWTANHRGPNRVPLMNQRCGNESAKVLLFREPNGYVTPCLLVRM